MRWTILRAHHHQMNGKVFLSRDPTWHPGEGILVLGPSGATLDFYKLLAPNGDQMIVPAAWLHRELEESPAFPSRHPTGSLPPPAPPETEATLTRGEYVGDEESLAENEVDEEPPDGAPSTIVHQEQQESPIEAAAPAAGAVAEEPVLAEVPPQPTSPAQHEAPQTGTDRVPITLAITLWPGEDGTPEALAEIAAGIPGAVPRAARFCPRQELGEFPAWLEEMLEEVRGDLTLLLEERASRSARRPARAAATTSQRGNKGIAAASPKPVSSPPPAKAQPPGLFDALTEVSPAQAEPVTSVPR